MAYYCAKHQISLDNITFVVGEKRSVMFFCFFFFQFVCLVFLESVQETVKYKLNIVFGFVFSFNLFCVNFRE